MNWSTTKLAFRKFLSHIAHQSGLNVKLSERDPQAWRILTYHRVVEPEAEPFPIQAGMYVRPQTFALHMKYLRERANVVSLTELLNSLKQGLTIPPRTVAITFDDGWVDNFRAAFPLLRDWNVPASIFLATAYVGKTELFWTDRLSEALSALLREPKHKEQIRARIRASDAPRIFIEQLEEIFALGHINAEKLDNMISSFKEQKPNERKVSIDTLQTLRKEFTTSRSTRLFCDWDEVREMARAGIEFGSHSHHHQPMSELSDKELDDDLFESEQRFRSNDLSPLQIFCYPGGYYNDTSQEALKRKGYTGALVAKRKGEPLAQPPLFGRINVHEDISSSKALFSTLLWGPRGT